MIDFERPTCIHRSRILMILGGLLALLVGPLALAQGSDDPPADESPAPEVAPELEFEESVVSFRGATPSGRVVVFSLGRDRQNWVPRVLRMEHLVEADEEGAGRVELEEPVIARSVWAVIDLATGEYVLTAPEGTELQRKELPAEGLGANLRFLEQESRFLDVLLVRPESGPEGPEAAGFWGAAVGDGASLDRDGEANSRLTLDLTNLQPLGESTVAPDRLRPKDVLIGVDPQTLEVFAKQLADDPDDGQGGGGSVNGNSGNSGNNGSGSGE